MFTCLSRPSVSILQKLQIEGKVDTIRTLALSARIQRIVLET